MDSPLEGDGFEPSVPQKNNPFWLPALGPAIRRNKNRLFRAGTDGSNPSPSSGELAANFDRARRDPRYSSSRR